MKDYLLHQRIIELSLKHKLSHVSSCLTAVDIINEIYSQKDKDEVFILSSGHAALALYVVMEKYQGISAESLLQKHGVHPSLDKAEKIYCSTGSLGLGITVAVGYALSDRTKNVYCLISDGESFEGSVWESLNFAGNHKLVNLKVYANINGYSAYDKIDQGSLIAKLVAFLPTINIRLTDVNEYPSLQGIGGHYKVLTENPFYDDIGVL